MTPMSSLGQNGSVPVRAARSLYPQEHHQPATACPFGAIDRDRGEPRGSALPHHRTYGSVYGGSRSYASALRSNDSTRVGWAFGFMHHRERFDVFPQRLPGFTRRRRCNWMFSRLSLSRFMSYLPLLSFGPSVTVPGSAYLLTPPFGMECLTSLADDIT